jgi:hypothetical protein
MHMNSNGWMSLDDADVRLGELLAAPGDAINYLYDLGDGWSHKLTLEAVADEADSTGASVLLDGGGACPPEDSRGLADMGVKRGFDKLLQRAAAAAVGDAAAMRDVVKARGEAAGALNYKGAEHASSLALYPTGFDIAAARKRIAAALASRASVPSGAKTVVTPLGGGFGGFGGGGGGGGEGWFGGPTGPGLRSVSVPAGCSGSGAFLTETLSTRRDAADIALCDACGSPANLKVCARCRGVRYCGDACQRAAWKAGHKAQCVPVGGAQEAAASKGKGKKR